jgi:hypothetical protein
MALYAPEAVLERITHVEDGDRAAVQDVFAWRPLPAEAYDVGPFQLELLSHYVPNAGVRLSTPEITVAYTGDTGRSRRVFSELEWLRGATSEEQLKRRKDLAEHVTIELVRHSVAEEVLVYPKVEDKVSAEEVEHARKAHAEAEETLHGPEKLTPRNRASTTSWRR